VSIVSRRVRPRTDVKVSAVIPFFNDGVVVEEALDSLRRQTRAVDQIVVVDDGSTDASSLSALAALERAGITVVRQHNQGPGPARNFGVAQCDGDAILFLDSTDVVTEQHVERALATLAGAPDEVGFVYPDMQFLGNESHLVVMPPYNLYLLLHRNFCCMGGIIDRSVFEAGFGFRTDRPVGHEDWDFFVRLGIHGVFGHPFHGAPLGYRRWGYSLSDGVTESAAGLAYVRDLHPDLNRHGRLIEIKREWAPALSVVIPAPGAHIAAHQTCDDFEVVAREGAQVPPTRGRWVLLLDEEGMAALADESFVERVLRLVGSGARPSPVALHAPAARDTGWTRSPVSDEDGGTRRGVVAEGHYYLDWSRTATATATPDVAAFCAYLDAVAGPVARWSYADRTSDVSTVALSDFRRSRPPPERPGDPVEFSGSEVERAFRHHEAVPLFMPDGGLPRLPGAGGSLRDGLGAVIDRAWSDWMPARSRQLDLVVDVFGQATLETGDISDASSEATARQPARIPIGLLWTQPFPGTACLAEHLDPSSHAVTHRVTLEKPAGPGVTVLGYVPTEFLPGRIGLLQSIGERMEFVVGPQRVSLHPVVDLVGGAFVEPSVANAGPGAGRETPDLDPPGAPADAPASRPRLRGRRRAR
jgi:glycosyltransferase involved in cell wall biosynthesis